jgi:integrase
MVAALSAHHDRQVERAAAAGVALPADAYVFSDDVLGQQPWRPDSTSRKYRHLRWWVAGLSESRLHDLRHFMATQLLGAGVDPKVVAQRGGWSKVATMLDRYAHLSTIAPQLMCSARCSPATGSALACACVTCRAHGRFCQREQELGEP